MPLIYPKKTRKRTAPITTQTTLRGRLEKIFSDQHAVPRLLVVTLFVVLLVVVIQGWNPVFPYRQGDRIDRAITARVSFKRLNRFETDRIRAQREYEQPYIFHHDATSVKNLPAKLSKALKEVASAKTVEDLPPETRTAFGLTEATIQTPKLGPPKTVEEKFQEFKQSLIGKDDSPGNQIDDILLQFQQFIAPLERNGLVSPQDLTRHQINPDQTLAIDSANTLGEPEIVSPDEVMLAELVKETGRLGKSWSLFPDLQAIKPELVRWMLTEATPTLQYDATATQLARERAMANAPEAFYTYNPGDILLKSGQVIDEEALGILESEYRALLRDLPWYQTFVRLFTIVMMLVVLVVLVGYYLKRNEPKIYRSMRYLSVYLGAHLLTILAARILADGSWRAEIVPVLAIVMIFAVSYNQVLAMISAVSLSLLVTLEIGSSLGDFITMASVCAIAIIPLPNVTSRISLIKVGLLSGIGYFCISWGVSIVESQSLGEIWADAYTLKQSLLGALKCLIAGYLVAGSLPFVESAFGVVTDISLLEMTDVSHPLLQELVRRAPGTYNHSMAVATIGQTAADKIGANGLLVRVGAYFHDIGKMLKPQYFIENVSQGTESRHVHLAPAMSTLIIIGHVKDGVELARQHNLPQRLIDFIEQHHGTTLVEYFYREAAKLADSQPDHKHDVEESSFRYPGPKPQSKEAAVMMLSDAVESASRTLSEPTPKRIESLVHSLTMKRLMEGQFNESPLSLNEIRIVEESLIKSLIGIYHGRIKYPDQQSA